MPDGKSFEQIEKEKKAAAAAAAEAEKKAEPLVLEEDDEFEEFEQEGALALAPSFLPSFLASSRRGRPLSGIVGILHPRSFTLSVLSRARRLDGGGGGCG
jgi:hypothetical protein